MLLLTKKAHQLGFTLIELMVVIAIIGLLMAAGLVSYTTAQKNARDAKRESDIDAVGKALEQYNTTNGVYPVAGAYSDLTAPLAALLLQGPPVDPRSPTTDYSIWSTATGFCTCAQLENLGKGNATGAAPTSGAPVCSFGTVASGMQGYFCVQNQQ